LADRGHRVTLADLSPNLLDIAREHLSSPRVDEIVEADARDLSRWTDDSFDATLVLGPLYHLPDASDRERVIDEVLRVTRPGGTVFVGLMPVLSLLRRTAGLPDERHHLTDAAFMAELLGSGEFANDVPGRFTHAWGVRPEAVAPWLEGKGLETIALASSEGFVVGIEEAYVAAQDTPDVQQALLHVVLATATDSSLLGLAKHLIYIGRRV
jgi:SAM-dependent methyltransferase